MSPSQRQTLASRSKEVRFAFDETVVAGRSNSPLRTYRGPACRLCGRRTSIAVEAEVGAASTFQLSVGGIGKAAQRVRRTVDALCRGRKERHLLAKLGDYNV